MERNGLFRKANGRTTYSLLELAELIEGIVSQVFEDRYFWIIAEITDVYFSKERQYYRLTLSEKPENGKVAVATFSATIWRNILPKVKHFENATDRSLSKGMKVMVSVKVKFHKVYGLSLDVYDIDPNFTIGELQQQKQLTLNALLEDFPEHIWQNEEGEIITSNKLIPLPKVFLKVALISSQDTQGAQDFLNELSQNQYGYKVEVQLFQSLVQGDEAPQQLCNALAKASRLSKQLDAMVIVRGGGASTDLLAFDDYMVAANIASYPIPVITGIGHTRDTSLSDVMAWQSVKTPTKAAEAIISWNYQSEISLLTHFRSIMANTNAYLTIANNSLSRVAPLIIGATKQIIQEEKFNHQKAISVINQKSQQMIFVEERKLQPISTGTLLAGQKLLLAEKGKLLKLNFMLALHAERKLSKHKANLQAIDKLVFSHNPNHWLQMGGAILSGKSELIAGDERTLQTKNQTATITIKDIYE